MTNHHTYNHSPQVGKFPAINPNALPANQDQATDPIPVRRFTAPGFDASRTSIVNLQEVNVPTPAEHPTEPQKHSWEIADERWAAYHAKQAEKQAEKQVGKAEKREKRKAKVAKVLGIVGIKKSAK